MSVIEEKLKYEMYEIPISQQTKIEGINMELREMKCLYDYEI